MSAAKSSKLDTGIKLLELLQRRLDNVVFRAGFAATIPAARQLIRPRARHRQRTPWISLYTVNQGDLIRPREKTAKEAFVLEAVKSPSLIRPSRCVSMKPR